MSETRIIKKYPNRRLYDTATSRYITVDDVRNLVLEHVNIKVVDARSNEDITRSILLQIITEQEEKGHPFFSAGLLEQIIRFYGDSLQGLITEYMENSLELFLKQHVLYRDQLINWMRTNPVALMNTLTERNLALWQSIIEGLSTQQGADHRETKVTEQHGAAPGPEQMKPPEGK
jgi:polyhydroxyalkanoate synthesis repressor PhaR